ncbi:hypothetical protein BGZ72_010599 [Mortierella alpina]|nr:hypothetical protein BGZ72_010599 [Mortierella alpina]
MRFSTVIVSAALASVAFAGFWSKCTIVPKQLGADKGFITRFVLPLPGTSIQVYYPELHNGGESPIVVYTLDGTVRNTPFGYKVHIKQQLGRGDWYYWKVSGGDEITMMDNMASAFVLEGDHDRFIIMTADGKFAVQSSSDRSLKIGDRSSALQLRLKSGPSCATSG